MSKIVWGSKKEYQSGCNKAVLYMYEGGDYLHGVAWDGITDMSRETKGGEIDALYSGGIRVRNLFTQMEYGFSITCYSYPEEFEPCIGETEIVSGMIVEQQERAMFGVSYQTQISNMFEPDAGYYIHLVYGCMVASYDYENKTINSSPEPVEFTFDVETIPSIPSDFEGLNAIAHVKINSTKTDPERLAMLLDILYGTDEEDPRMPLPDEVAEILSGTSANDMLYPGTNMYPDNNVIPIGS